MKSNIRYFIAFIGILLLLFYKIVMNTLFTIDIERFTNNNASKTVNLFDLSIKSNFCGPSAKCSVTGEQCFYDTDCVETEKEKEKEKEPFANNSDDNYDGYVEDNSSRAPIANLGVNTWSSVFNAGQRLFDKRYKSNQLQYMPQYSSQYTLTGNFTVQEPVGYR